MEWNVVHYIYIYVCVCDFNMQVPNGVDDIDAPDVFNEQMEALYAHGIFLYYKRREVRFSNNMELSLA